LSGCISGPLDDRELIVLYTNDEHGWMEGVVPERGAANLFGIWREREGFQDNAQFLVLSGGDNWTGPAVSTWNQGQGMVQVMNAMHYDASAVGNHEFDFGLRILGQRSGEADFSYLSANTRWRENGQVPTDLGIQPYTIEEVNGLQVGIIGLTTTSTPSTTLPTNVLELEFRDYESTLRELVPLVRAANVDLLFVIAHVCVPALEALIPRVADLGIDLFGAGHCNELLATKIGDTILLGGGTAFESYARATISYDPNEQRIGFTDLAVEDNLAGLADTNVSSIIAYWQQQVASQTSRVIAHNDTELARTDPQLRQAVIDSWLWADPTADIAITNGGGLRTAFPAGEISLGTIVAIMPFENTIVAANLSGAVIRQVLAEGRDPVFGGLIRDGETWRLAVTRLPLDENTVYRVLINNFMYAGGDGYTGLMEADPQGFDTGIHYRQPFVDWLESQQSTKTEPLTFK